MTDAFEDAFAVKDTQPAPTPEAIVQPVPIPVPVATPAPVVEAPKVEAPKPEPAHIPVTALLDERDKRQRAERERDELRAQVQPKNIPSFQDDPEAFAQHLAQETQRVAVGERFNTSEFVAREKHGDEPVTSAMDWGMQRSQESPAFAAEYLKQKHPIDWVVRQHKRDRLVNEIGENDEAYVRRRYAELNPTAAPIPVPQAPAAQAAPQPAPPQQPLPTRSLASATSAGGVQVNPVPGEAEAFKATFSR